MPVKGDDVWNGLMASVEQDAQSGLQGQAEEELKRRGEVAQSVFPNSSIGQAAVTGAYRAKDALNAAAVGAYDAAFQTKDFITSAGGLFDTTKQQDKSQFRLDVERTSKELKALSSWNGAIEGVSQFVTGFVGAGKFVKARGLVADGLRAAGVGAVATDPTEERLSNFIQSAPWAANPITDYLAAKPGDSKAAGRLKNAMESVLMDAVAAGAIVSAAKVIKLRRAGDKVGAEAAMKEVDEANVKLGNQEEEHYAKSFLSEEDTAAAQADIERAQMRGDGTTVDPNSPGMNKDFLGTDVSRSAGEGAPGLGGRAEALDRELRAGTNDTPEVPGSSFDASAPNMETPNAPQPDARPQVQPEAPVAAPATGGGQPAAVGDSVAPLAADVRAASAVPDAGIVEGATTGASQVPRAEARGARELKPQPLADIPPEQMQRVIQRMNIDDNALADAGGSVEAALQDGHKFAGAGTIPWQKLNAQGAAKAYVAEVVDANKELVRKVKGGDAEGVMRDAKVDKLVQQMSNLYDLDPAAVMGKIRSGGDAAREMVAVAETGMRLTDSAFLQNYEFVRRLQADNLMGYGSRAEALEALRQRTMVAMDIYANTRAMTAASGRLLRRQRSEFRARADQMAQVNIAKMDPELLLGIYRGVEGNPSAAAKMLQPSVIEQIVDGVNLFRMANILSGPTTQIVNTVSNAAMLGFRPLTAYLGSYGQSALSMATHNEALAASARVMRQRAKVEMVSTAGTISEGLQAFKKAFLIGDSIMAPHNSTEAFEALSGGVGGEVQMLPWRDFKTIDDVIANGIKAFSYLGTADLRIMGAADEMVKNMRYRSVIMGRAAVEADEMGLKAGSKAYKDHLVMRANEGFDEAGRAIDAEALKEARVTTFQQDLKLDKEDTWGGYQTLGSAASNFTSNYPIAKLIVPFIKTPSNLFRYGIKLTPGLNLLQKEYVNALRGAHGPMGQATAMGEMAMSIMLLTAGVQLRMGDRMTGSGPRDPKQAREWKAQGNMPYAIRMDGNNTFQINRFDPLQMPVALAADFVDMYMLAQNKGEGDQLETYAQGAVLALAHQLKDKTYYKGASDFMDALNDDKKLRKWGERFVPGLIPGSAMLKHLNSDPFVREVNGFADSIKATFPGWSEDIPKRYDALGRPVTIPGKFVNTKDFDNPLTRALDAQFAMTGTSLTAPQPKVQGVDLREFTLKKDGRNAFEAYNQLIHKPKGLRDDLPTALEKLVQSRNYSAAPHGETAGGNTKEYMVANTINSYRTAAMAQLKKENPDLAEALGKKARDNFQKAMAGKKDLKSVEANAAGKQLNDLLRQQGFSGSVPVPQVQPEQ